MKLGVTIRINVVAKATAALMDTAISTRTSPNQFRTAVYTFGKKAEDTKLLEVTSLTDDLAAAKGKASLIDLMSIPYQGYNNDQQTDFVLRSRALARRWGHPGLASVLRVRKRSCSSYRTELVIAKSLMSAQKCLPAAGARSPSI